MAQYKQRPRTDLSHHNVTQLETKSRTILGTRTELLLKKELIVYKENDKFYIEPSAAYALGLVNVKNLMSEESSLVEISLNQLLELKNNHTIEIQYQELSKSNYSRTDNKIDLDKVLGELEGIPYGIGVHGIHSGSQEEKEEIASIICHSGLQIINNNRTILSTSISLGISEYLQGFTEEISEYNYGNGTKVNVVIAVPIYIQNENGETIFLGFPEKNKYTSGQQYDEHCILDKICSRLRKVPAEFILGYYCEGLNGEKIFIKNPKHYSNLSNEEREGLFEELSENMDDISISINNFIANGNIEKLQEIQQKMRQRGMTSYVYDNAIELIRINKQRGNGQFTALKSKEERDASKSHIRRVLLKKEYTAPTITIEAISEIDKTVSPEKRKSVRRVLIELIGDKSRDKSRDESR